MGLTVLVVDDEADIRELIKLNLLWTPLEVVGEAADGREAVELVAELRPSFVLMDLMMPIEDGVSATRRIRADFPDVTVIGFTGADDGPVDDLLSAGAAAVFNKTAFEETLDQLRTLIGLELGELLPA